jgi:2,4-dienoyl-CoA reductase-like NADH-dependent reductase (Old Yellow Enzyme family)
MNKPLEENPFYATRGENARKVLQRDRDPMLFRPYPLRSVTAKNRIVVSPMCQYCAQDGLPDDWHFQHLASRAVGGAGIVFAEATAVSATGRATPFDLGLYNDTQQEAFARINRFIKTTGALPGLQIVHAGRKASCKHPIEGNRPIPLSDGGWETIAPSPLPFREEHPSPREMTKADIDEVISDFAQAARRARDASFDVLEIHAAHGYLIHQFLSPLSNVRTDAYGGSFENRIRFLLEIIDAIRAEWSDTLSLFVRISATDWVEGGWNLEESIQLAKILKEGGKVDLVDCSSGGLSPVQKITIYPGYQVQFAEAVKREADISTGAVGLINNAELAEAILWREQADLIYIGRGMLGDPYWPIRAAKTLRASFAWPVQYERGDIY